MVSLPGLRVHLMSEDWARRTMFLPSGSAVSGGGFMTSSSVTLSVQPRT
jgi:hypothetical protein